MPKSDQLSLGLTSIIGAALTTMGEAIRHGGHKHGSSTTSGEQGRKGRHEDTLGPGAWPAPLPRQRPVSATEQDVQSA